jgi:hypothetical protein
MAALADNISGKTIPFSALTPMKAKALLASGETLGEN